LRITHLLLFSWVLALAIWSFSGVGRCLVLSGAKATAGTTRLDELSSDTGQADAIAEVCHLIYKGQFETAGEKVGPAKAFDEGRARLLEQVVGTYREITQQRQAARAKDFAEQVAELDELKASVDLAKLTPQAILEREGEPNEPNDISDVLAVITRAVESADAEQRASLMADPYVAKALQTSLERSAALEAEGKWLDAYAEYYYWLGAIDPNNTGYADHAEGLLDKASIAASFQNSPCETRKERYSGVEKRMFVRAIEALNLHYVNSIDYAEMSLEAVNRCGALTEVLTVGFPEGLDSENGSPFAPPAPEKVTAWSVALAGLRDEIETATGSFGKDNFLKILEKVLALNKATVQLPREPLIAHFAEAALETLDPHTVMVWPRQVQDFEKLMMNEYSGIGIELSGSPGLLTVGSLMPDTPAYRSGLDAGDIIESVDGIPTKDMSVMCAIKKITGPKGTSVTLAVRRRNAEDAETITITRDRIIVPTIRGWQRTESGDWLYVVDERNRIGYVRITSFTEETADDFEAVLRELEAAGLKGLIVDLRFNRGGLWDSGVEVSDKFLEEGLIVRTQPKASMIPTFEYAHRRKTHPDYPLVILINSHSASASEIVAGALADEKHERATLVGTRTHGKGSVQGITSYPGGGAQLKYTMAYYHLPSGQRVGSREAVEKQGGKDWGIGPDVAVKLTSGELRELLDVQRDNDVLVQAGRDEHSATYKKRTIEESLRADPQLAVGLLVVKAKLVEAGTVVTN
jgi:carboxyl-terminal processing protease